MHEGMQVSREETHDGSRIVPELDQAWDDLTKLRWKAGIAVLDTGLPIRLAQAAHGFAVQVGTLSTTLDFGEAWLYLEGVRVGGQSERAALERVRQLHTSRTFAGFDGQRCTECCDGWGHPNPWPCPTIDAVNGKDPTP